MGGPFKHIMDHDIFLNTILLQKKIPPFITKELLKSANSKTSVVVDVSCDPNNPNNPVPIYNEITSLANPVRPICGGKVDVISIDHLPALIPSEASTNYSAAMLPHYKTLFDPKSCGVWTRARKTFEKKLAELTEDEEKKMD